MVQKVRSSGVRTSRVASSTISNFLLNNNTNTWYVVTGTYTTAVPPCNTDDSIPLLSSTPPYKSTPGDARGYFIFIGVQPSLHHRGYLECHPTFGRTPEKYQLQSMPDGHRPPTTRTHWYGYRYQPGGNHGCRASQWWADRVVDRTPPVPAAARLEQGPRLLFPGRPRLPVLILVGTDWYCRGSIPYVPVKCLKLRQERPTQGPRLQFHNRQPLTPY